MVASDRTANPEVAGDAALIVKAKDPEAMASGIIRFLSNKEIRHDFIARGYRRVRNFDWAEAARQMHKILVETSLKGK